MRMSAVEYGIVFVENKDQGQRKEILESLRGAGLVVSGMESAHLKYNSFEIFNQRRKTVSKKIVISSKINLKEKYCCQQQTCFKQQKEISSFIVSMVKSGTSGLFITICQPFFLLLKKKPRPAQFFEKVCLQLTVNRQKKLKILTENKSYLNFQTRKLTVIIKYFISISRFGLQRCCCRWGKG